MPLLDAAHLSAPRQKASVMSLSQMTQSPSVIAVASQRIMCGWSDLTSNFMIILHLLVFLLEGGSGKD